MARHQAVSPGLLILTHFVLVLDSTRAVAGLGLLTPDAVGRSASESTSERPPIDKQAPPTGAPAEPSAYA